MKNTAIRNIVDNTTTKITTIAQRIDFMFKCYENLETKQRTNSNYNKSSFSRK